MVDVLMRRAIATAALVLLAGCGGGGGGGAAPVPSTPKQSGTVQKTIKLVVPGYNPSKSLKSQYVSRNTQGIGVSYGASPFTFPVPTAPTSAFDVSVAGGQCTITNATTNARTCTITIGAPVGTDDFQVTAWDTTPVGGHFTSGSALSTVTLLSQTIASGANTPLNLTLNGIVTSVNTSVSPSSIPAFPVGGAPVTATVSVNALDADGNVIMDSGSNWIDGNGNVLSISVNPCATANGGNVATTPGAPIGVTPATPTFTETYSGGPTWGTSFPVTITGTTASIPTSAATLNITPTVTLFPIPSASSGPNGLTLGPDHNVWFTETNASNVSSISQTGSINEVSLAAAGFSPPSVPTGIASVNGVVYWLDASGGEKMEFLTPPNTAVIGNSSLAPGWIMNQMVLGPDGNLWFTQTGPGPGPGPGAAPGAVQSYNPTNGGSTGYSTPPYTTSPGAIVVGPDNKLWFTETGGGAIQNVTTAGTFSASPFPIAGSSPQPVGIASGPDGNLWFTDKNGQDVGVMNTSGVQTHTYSAPLALGQLGYIIAGPDGAMWFAGMGAGGTGSGGIGRVTLSGVMTSYFTGFGTADNPTNLIVGGDGNIWFTDPGANKIGRLIY